MEPGSILQTSVKRTPLDWNKALDAAEHPEGRRTLESGLL